MIKRIAALVTTVIILAGCSNKNRIIVDGNFSGGDHDKIYLDRIDVDTPVIIDSAEIRKNGNFRFKIESTDPEFYQVGFNNSDFITILAAPGERIKLRFKGKRLYEDFDISGSEGSEKIKMLDMDLALTLRKIDSVKVIYETASKDPGFEKIEPLLNEEYVKLIKEQRKKNIEFIIKNLNSFASIKALYQRIDENTYVLYDPRDLQFFKLVSDSLTHHHPNSKQATALKKNFEKEMSQRFLNQVEQIAKNAPETKLDPDLKDINGKRISLSSLKGKIVLLTFWSTSSEASLSENMMLKEFYTKYKSRGFEIYQINLDEDETRWKNGVKFDELPWISVREDDPANPLYARVYNVRSVPYNVLFDKTGTIIGYELHGRTLQIRLSQLFGN